MKKPAWGDHVDEANMEDICVSIQETINMDEEHGAFWIGYNENEKVLEVHQDVKAFFFIGNEQLTTIFNSWQEIEHLFLRFLQSDFAGIESTFLQKME